MSKIHKYLIIKKIEDLTENSPPGKIGLPTQPILYNIARTRKISTSEMARSIRRLYEIYDLKQGVNKKYKGGEEPSSYPETLTLKDVANSIVLKLNTINTLISQNKTLSK